MKTLIFFPSQIHVLKGNAGHIFNAKEANRNLFKHPDGIHVKCKIGSEIVDGITINKNDPTRAHN